MKYTVEIGSGAMIYIPSFIKTVLKHSKLIGGVYEHTDSMVIS
jgi:hypothetical protein